MIKTLEIPIDVPEGATHYTCEKDLLSGIVEFWKYDNENKEWNFYDPEFDDWEPLRKPDRIKHYEPIIKPIIEVQND